MSNWQFFLRLCFGPLAFAAAILAISAIALFGSPDFKQEISSGPFGAVVGFFGAVFVVWANKITVQAIRLKFGTKKSDESETKIKD